MDPERTRVEEDLRGIVSGEVLCSDAERAAYATDASLFEVWPLAVVRPRTVEDVVATVQWAASRGIAVHPRGAGSSVCGGALGAGVVLDCSRFMRRIVRTDDESVRVQPGVVATQLEDHLARCGRVFGPDPPHPSVTTVGGMVGRNSSGSRFLLHGAVRSRILTAEVVLADGSLVELEPTSPAEQGSRAGMLAAGVAAVLAARHDAIARGQPATRATHGGYGLRDLDDGARIHLPRLLCGAEGTLGIVTEVTLRTVPAAGAAAVGLVLFDSLERAADAALRIAALGPSACDLFDKRHLALARGTKPAFDLLIPSVAEAGLLVEFTAADRRQANLRLEDALRLVQRSRKPCLDVRRAEDDFDAAFFWELSRNVVSTLHGVRAAVRPVPFVEDVLVPPAALPDFLRRLQEVLKRCQFTAMLFGHAGHGQLHVRPYVDPRADGERARLEELARAVAEAAAESGGTIGAEQGLGLSRIGPFTACFPELAAACVEVRRVFDPAGTLNPGRIGDPRAGDPPVSFRGGLRPAADAAGAEPRPTPGVEPALSWPALRMVEELDACNGCGGCRTQASTTRMCPRFREDTTEEASPRAKANLLAAVLSGAVDPKTLAGDAARGLADTCFNCHQCRSGCSAGVDIPALVTELKAAHLAQHALRPAAWFLSRVDTLSAVGGGLRPLANWALANPQARWLLEKATGIARGRKLPPFSGGQFIRWASRRGITRPSRRSGPRVLFFLDTYARRHDPLLAQAFVSVLEHNGIGVFVDPRQVAAGMPLVAEGDVDAARRLARTNLRVLAEAVRLGYRIVSTEPAAVTCLTHDYPLLVEDEELPRVTAAVTDAMTFLWELHREGRLRLDFRPIAAQLLYHAPCHARLGGGLTAAEHLLRLVPGLAVDAADRGCSGMAGTFGLAREHYRASLRIGLGLVSAMRGGVQAGATECSACRIQMEQGTTKPAVHPVKILAKAYGLLEGPAPHGLDTLLTATSGRLTTT